MQTSEILNFVLGGGLLALIRALLKLRSTVLKAKAEAEKAKAEAETVRLDNAEHATRILIEDILAPLREELASVRGELTTTKDELSATRKDLGSTKREMARLRKAIDTANRCEHHDECPVLIGLRDLPKGSKDDGADGGEDRSPPADTACD